MGGARTASHVAAGRTGSRGLAALVENMAELRVRLKFDYPPPAEPHNRHMWMLLNTEHLRIVTDLSDLIRARYYPGLRGALCLYVHDCLLPPGESARLIRDNDVIRVQWIGHDLEDDDSDKHGRQSKRRSRQEEEEEDAAAMTPKKPKYDRISEGSRTKVKRKKSDEEKAATKIVSLLRPNLEPPTKRVRARSGSSSHHETSTISIQPTTTIEVKNPAIMTLQLFDALSVKKNLGEADTNLCTPLSINEKPSKTPPLLVHVTNHESFERKESSSSDSETSSDQEPSTRTQEPSKFLRKPESTNSAKKAKSKLASSKRKESSSSDSETSSDQEPSTRTKEPPKVLTKPKPTDSSNRTKSKLASSKRKESSSSDSETSSDQEPSTRTKELPNVLHNPEATNSANKTKSKHGLRGENSSEFSTIGKKAGTTVSLDQNITDHTSGPDTKRPSHKQNSVKPTSNPSEAITGNLVFPCEIRKDSPSCDRTVSSVDGVTVSPHNGVTSSGSHSDTRPMNDQCFSSLTTGGVHQKHGTSPALYGRGRGRGIDLFPWRGQGGQGLRGRGEQGRGHRFFHNYDSATLKKHQLQEAITNTSVIIENPRESPRKDYDTFPLLAAPPQAGRVIAFKILELDENYSPELSDYKEGVVCSYDHVTQHIEVELLSKQKRREPGKFDLVYESEDGQEVVEYAVVPECKITQPWSSLITPRLVMEKRPEDGSLPQ